MNRVAVESPPVKPSPGTHFRWILILLVPVVAGSLVLLSNLYNYSFYPSSHFFISVYAFLVLPLATLEWYYAYSGRVQTRKPILLFSIGILATVGSAFHNTLLTAAGPCSEGVSGGGFPLPWYLNFMFYMGRGPAPPCPLLNNPSWGLFALFSFLFDTIFYAAFAIAGNEFFTWAKRAEHPLTRGSKPGSKGTQG
jgi:hypothetical protein